MDTQDNYSKSNTTKLSRFLKAVNARSTISSRLLDDYYINEYPLYSKFKNNNCILLPTVKSFKDKQAFVDQEGLLNIQSSLSTKEIEDINSNKSLLIVIDNHDFHWHDSSLTKKSFTNITKKDNIKVVTSSPDVGSDEIHMLFECQVKHQFPLLSTSPLEKMTSKYYINLNRNLNGPDRLHRCALVLLLYQRNLLEYGHNSFNREPGTFSAEKAIEKFDGINFTNIEKFKNLLPLIVDTADFQYCLAFHNIGAVVPYMQDSMFSVVTETTYFNNKPRFLTEKTFKPIALKQPFILATVPKTLEMLRNMGYKTFHPYIDESYDQEQDDSKRLVKIVDEIERLCNMTTSEIAFFKEKLLEIVNYNHDLLHSKKSHIYHNL